MESETKLTIEWVAQILKSSSGKTGNLTSVCTDSRKISKGCLFVAIRGDKFDGHDFIHQAIEQGARAILCQADYANGTYSKETHKETLNLHESVAFFKVPSVETAFRELAAAWRNRFFLPVLCIAGSVGKTTTKELVAAALEGKWPGAVLKTQGSENGFLGIPITLLKLRDTHQAAVIEVGIDEIGSMIQHLPLVRATLSVITAIGPEHLEKLIDLETVSSEECLALSETLKAAGKIVVNLSDDHVRERSDEWRLNSMAHAFSLNASVESSAKCSSVWPIERSWSAQSTALESGFSELKIEGGDLKTPVQIKVPLPGAHNAMNALGAWVLARLAGASPSEIEKGWSTFQSTFGRSELKRLPSGTQVVCDYYNANPNSVEAGLALLAQITPNPDARWACLADMLELGTLEEKLHRGLARAIEKHQVSHILLMGPRMKWLEDELKKSSIFQGEIRHVSDHDAAAQILLSSLKPNDSLLIKGSRGMKMEEVWKKLNVNRLS